MAWARCIARSTPASIGPFAIKVLPSLLSDAPEFRERFDHEARAISQLSHPNICTLYDVGREGDVHFLVMEYLDGQTRETHAAPTPSRRAGRDNQACNGSKPRLLSTTSDGACTTL